MDWERFNRRTAVHGLPLVTLFLFVFVLLPSKSFAIESVSRNHLTAWETYCLQSGVDLEAIESIAKLRQLKPIEDRDWLKSVSAQRAWAIVEGAEKVTYLITIGQRDAEGKHLSDCSVSIRRNGDPKEIFDLLKRNYSGSKVITTERQGNGYVHGLALDLPGLPGVIVTMWSHADKPSEHSVVLTATKIR
jgi:hypothetical protein